LPFLPISLLGLYHSSIHSLNQTKKNNCDFVQQVAFTSKLRWRQYLDVSRDVAKVEHILNLAPFQFQSGWTSSFRESVRTSVCPDAAENLVKILPQNGLDCSVFFPPGENFRQTKLGKKFAKKLFHFVAAQNARAIFSSRGLKRLGQC